jgi:hypothetical protein
MTSYPPPPPEPGNEGERPPADPPQYPSYSQYQQDPAFQAYEQSPQGVPAYRPGMADVAPPARRPPSMDRAVMLMRAGAALSLLNVIIGLITLGTIKDNIRQQLIDKDNFSQSNLDSAYNVAIGVIIVAGIISIGLWLWMAWANGAGRKWARIVATVLGALSIVGFLSTLAQGQQTVLGVVLSAITAILAVAILVLLWNRESGAYYDAQSRRAFT